MVNDFAIAISSGTGVILYGLVLGIGIHAAVQDGRLLEKAVDFYLKSKGLVRGDFASLV